MTSVLVKDMLNRSRSNAERWNGQCMLELIMANKKFEFTKDQRFLRGLLFLSAGTFLLLRFAAGNSNGFFMIAAWLVGIVTLCSLVLFLWSVYQNME
jgi:Ca2+/Na+ antiporter